MTAAAPSDIASLVSAASVARPGLLTPTTTGTSPATWRSEAWITRRASS